MASTRSERSDAGGGWRAGIGLLVLGVLAVPAAVTLVSAGWAVGQPVGLDYAEPVVYGVAMRVGSGEPLYQPIDTPPYTVSAYTPLYYWLAGVLQMIAGAGFWPGRLLSLVAGLATAGLVGTIAGGRRRDAWVSACGTLLFLALAFAGPVPWLALYRVDTLGVALSVAAVALLTRRPGQRLTVAAGVLAGLAVLCKQTYVAALVAGTLWQWRDWPKAASFLTAAVLAFGVPCLALEVTSSGAFLENTVVANVNPFNLAIARGLLPIYLETQWVPLLLAVVYLAARRGRHASDSRLVVLYWAAASVPLMLGIAKIGANFNYWIEFGAATSILAARGAAYLMATSRRAVALAGAVGLVLALGIAGVGPNGAWASARTLRANLRAAPQVEFDALVDRVRHAPGGVLAEPLDVVVLAGRPLLLEPFIYNLLLDAGRWQPASLVSRICNGEIGLLVLGYPLEAGARMTDGLYALWPAPVMTALQDTMVFHETQAGRYVYMPRQSPGCGALAAS